MVVNRNSASPDRGWRLNRREQVMALVVLASCLLGAWLPGLFPPRVRYTGTSMAFNLGGILGGGLTPALAETLTRNGGGLMPVGLYLSAAGALSLIALIPLRRGAAK